MSNKNTTRKKFLKSPMLPLVAIIVAAPAWADIPLNQYIFNPGFEILSSPLANCGTADGTPGLYCNGSVAGWNSGGTGSGAAGTVQLSSFGPTGQTSAAKAKTDLGPDQGNNAAYINNYGQFIPSP